MRPRLIATALVLMAGAAQADVTVFAAASLKAALDEIVADYSARTGTTVVVSYGGTPALARQIEAGAPADVFISASKDWMDYLEERNLIQPDTRRDLLSNRLVLVTSLGMPFRHTLGKGAEVTALLGGRMISMALVDSVPAGQYGRQALTSLGVWDDVKDQVIQSENVAQALRLVEIGEVPFGIVYWSDVSEGNGAAKPVGLFPEQSHSRIIYPVALTSEGTEPEASAFLDYMATVEAVSVFISNGFHPIPIQRENCFLPNYPTACDLPFPPAP